MGKKLQNYQLAVIVVWMLFTFWLWSTPYQENRMPYGEFDAISHWEVGDYMATTNKPILFLPDYISLRYGGDNAFKANTLWYHPPYHTNFAVLESVGGDRILPTYMMNTILSIAFVLILFFIMNDLFGFYAGIGTAILASFSPRDYMVYLWGQWPERISYAFVGLNLLIFYFYVNSYLEKREEKKYLLLLGIFLAVTMYLHPMGFFHSIAALGVFGILLLIKEKKLPFSFKTASFAAVIFLVLITIFPYQTGSVVVQLFTKGSESGTAAQANSPDYGRLFYWFKEPDRNVGVPSSYFSFSYMNGLWTLPFLIIGIIFCLMLRKRKHLMMLAWLISLYIVIHADVIGKGPFVHRSLSATAHIFIPLTVIGFYYLIMFSSKLKIKKFAMPTLVAIFLIFAIMFNAKTAVYGLKEGNTMVVSPLPLAYDGLARMNQAQYNAADWILKNVPPNENITDVGVLDLKRARWIAGVSQHINIPYAPETQFFPTRANMTNYVLVDYSDIKYVANQDTINYFLQWEAALMSKDQLAYNKDDIHIYKVNKAITDADLIIPQNETAK